MPTDETQNIEIALIKNEFKNLDEKMNIRFSVLESLFTEFKERNCRKHDFILETLNKQIGSTERQITDLKNEANKAFATKVEISPIMRFYDRISGYSIGLIIVLGTVVLIIVSFITGFWKKFI